MRVLCIKQTPWVSAQTGEIFEGPVFGDMVTVTGSYESIAFISINEEEVSAEMQILELTK